MSSPGPCRALLAVLFIAPATAATTWHVDASVRGDPLEDGSIAHPFDRIQEAIDAATGGDIVLVAPGTYAENISFLGKSIHVRGLDGPAQTILDGSQAGSVVRFVSGEGPGAILEGFTIRNGGGFGSPAGIWCRQSSPTIRGNIITENDGGAQTGGLGATFSAHPTIIDNVFTQNVSGAGGAALAIHGAAATVIGNTFSSNRSELDPGGAIHAFDSKLLIEGNLFTDNLSFGPGGAAFFLDSSVQFTRNVVIANGPFRSGTGGGIAVSGDTGVEIDNCLIAGNSGGALFLTNASPTVRNCTITANTGGNFGLAALFLFDQAEPTIVQSIIWNNFASIEADVSSTAQVSFSDVQGGWPGVGNLNLDPLFVDAAQGDFALLAGSPAIEAGDPGDAQCGFDLAGTPRRLDGPFDGGSRVDMGALEFGHVHLELASPAPGLLQVIVSGTAGLKAWLFASLQPGLTCLDKWGTLGLSLSGPFVIVSWGTLPSSVTAAVPPAAAGVPLLAQVLAGPGTSAVANFSNVATIELP